MRIIAVGPTSKMLLQAEISNLIECKHNVCIPLVLTESIAQVIINKQRERAKLSDSANVSKVDEYGAIVDEWLIERHFGGLDGLTRFDSKTMGIPPNGFILIEAAGF